jgi:prepilin-type N-terminal cleavage/methylation domain-containing protein
MKNYSNPQSRSTQRSAHKKRVWQSSSTGFTIIELLIATTIFSIVLVVIVSSFLQVGRMFYKGVSVNNTNESTRNLVDSIANDARLSTFTPGGADSSDPSKLFFCIGAHRYTYKLNTQVKANDISTSASTMGAGIVQDTAGGSSCLDPTHNPGINPSQVLGPDMRLNALSVTKNTTGTSVMIHAHVIFYGVDKTVFSSSIHPNDTATDHTAALNDPSAYCSGNLLSTQFCAVSDIGTSVTLRY